MLHNKHNYSQVSCWSVYIHTDPNVTALGRVSFCIRCEFLRSGWDQHCLLFQPEDRILPGSDLIFMAAGEGKLWGPNPSQSVKHHQ